MSDERSTRKPGRVLGWLTLLLTGAGVSLATVLALAAVSAAFATFLVFVFLNEPPKLSHFTAILRHRPDPWARGTRVTPVVFEVEGPSGCSVDITIDIKGSPTLRAEHQPTPFFRAINVAHGGDVQLSARNECADRGWVEVKIDDRHRPVIHRCAEPACVAQATAHIE